MCVLWTAALPVCGTDTSASTIEQLSGSFEQLFACSPKVCGHVLYMQNFGDKQ